MYDYFLGGVHNFPIDREAARQVLAQYPLTTLAVRANRAFLGRAVRFLVAAGVRQFLDIGSGMPTVGNVHEIAEQTAGQTRVVYVDIDPVAVSESLELLAGNPLVTAIRGDVCVPEEILGHIRVRELLDFSQPIGLLMVALLHFVPDDDEAYRVVSKLVDALAPGSYLVISHSTTDGLNLSAEAVARGREVYRQQTATPMRPRTHAETARFFTTTDLVEPGLVAAPLWRPAPDDPVDFADNPAGSGFLAGIGHIHPR
jgi:SAM-dependent methyltransferase